MGGVHHVICAVLGDSDHLVRAALGDLDPVVRVVLDDAMGGVAHRDRPVDLDSNDSVLH